MSRARIVVTNRAFPETLDFLSSDGQVVAAEGDEPLNGDELLGHARDAHALLAFMTDAVDDAFLARCPALRVIACALKGADNFDAAACTRRGVWLTIVPDLLTGPTAELAVGLAIGLARHVLAADRTARAGAFPGWRPCLYGTSLDGSTVAILGAGRVGRAIARRLSGFDCTILMSDVRPDVDLPGGARRAPLAEAVAAAHYVFLALPLDASTLHLIDRSMLERFKPGALLINPARGSLVDEAAVAEALAAGRLGGYAADVFEFEDWRRPDRPAAIEPRLLRAADRTLFTTHLGSAVERVRRAIELDAAANIREALRGERPHGAVNDPRPAQYNATAARRDT
jgi:phosphonate dehydrogenase